MEHLHSQALLSFLNGFTTDCQVGSCCSNAMVHKFVLWSN